MPSRTSRFVAFITLMHGVSTRDFQVATLSDTSMVIRMVEANNVTRFDMRVQIFDLDHLVEYRRTELSGSTKDQVCPFPLYRLICRLRVRVRDRIGRHLGDFGPPRGSSVECPVVRRRANRVCNGHREWTTSIRRDLQWDAAEGNMGLERYSANDKLTWESELCICPILRRPYGIRFQCKLNIGPGPRAACLHFVFDQRRAPLRSFMQLAIIIKRPC